MATVFDSHFAAAGFPMLLDQFGESITYYPAAGGSRSIQAIVNRDPPEILDGSGNAVMPKALLQVLNSTTSGIGSSEVNIGSDEVGFPLRINDVSANRFSLLLLQSQSGGVTVLAVV